MKKEARMIYNVQFHVNPKKKVHTFWFTGREAAEKFLESVKAYPKTLDYMLVGTPVDEAVEYDGKVEEGSVLILESSRGY